MLIIRHEKDSYFFLEELSFEKTLFHSLAILQMIIIAMEAKIDQATDANASVMFERSERTEITL